MLSSMKPTIPVYTPLQHKYIQEYGLNIRVDASQYITTFLVQFSLIFVVYFFFVLASLVLILLSLHIIRLVYFIPEQKRVYHSQYSVVEQSGTEVQKPLVDLLQHFGGRNWNEVLILLNYATL